MPCFRNWPRKRCSEVHLEEDGLLYISLDYTHAVIFIGSSAAQWLKAYFLDSWI